MRKCPYCDETFDETLSYCPSCGASYSEEAVHRAYTARMNMENAKKQKAQRKKIALYALVGVLCVISFFVYQKLNKGIISTNVANGVLYVEDKMLSRTPCEISIKQGTYKVKIVSGNDYWKGNVVVMARQVCKPVGDLTALPKREDVAKKAKVNTAVSTQPKKKTITIKHKTNIPKQRKKNLVTSSSADSAKSAAVVQHRSTSAAEQSSAVEAARRRSDMEAARRRREENLRRIQNGY